MSKPTSAAGEGLCDNPECGRPVVWRRNEGGTLSYHCQWCGMQAYAKAGSRANADISAHLPMSPVAAQGEPAAPAVATNPPKKSAGLLLG